MKPKMKLLAFAALVLFSLQSPAVTQLKIASKGQEMAFDKTTLTVKAGEKVKLLFKNGSGMQHNWVLVAPGTADKVAQDCMTAGPTKGWLTNSPNILAHTKLLDPNKSETIEFTAPSKPGDYPYICSFPGHSMTMRGILKVN